MTTDVVITNNENSKQFLFRAVNPFTNTKLQPATAIPLVNTTSASNVLFRFVGQTEEVRFTFAIFDNGSDVSAGDNIITVSQQIDYLRDNIYTKDWDTDWTLAQSRFYPDGAISGVITNLSFDNKAGAGTIVTGSLLFKRGRIASL